MKLFGAIRREAIYISSIARTLWLMRRLKPMSARTIVDIVEEHAHATPGRTAILYENEVIGYGTLDARANRYARWAEAHGVARGDAVALLMENRPDYIAAWLGLFKVGAVVALINTNQRGAALAHSIAVAGAGYAIVDAELAGPYGEAAGFLDARPALWIAGGKGQAVADGMDIEADLAARSSAPFGKASRAGVTCKDRAFYIYTSGTTGMPKAANISHLRMLYMMYGFAGALGARAGDRIYDALPLYHSTGGICAVGIAFIPGGALIIKRKFSVHEFWDDIHKYQATLFQYIGELCRYLLNMPEGPHEQDHHIRAITGNGLRPEIWPTFQKRFAIPRIVEFYGATEGNVSMLNYDGKIGAVGRIPSYMRWMMTVRIVRFDIEKESPVRDANGFCAECGPDEAGEAVGQIADEPGKNFEGYTKSADTEKKILRHVFEPGDAWFRTGDLMRRDALGYFYFVDRIGDTFRWKAENVATSEVAEALGVIPGIREANVYGVKVPGHDGRAGMAALVAGPDFDISGLAGRLAGNLAAYARPVFLRLAPAMDVTGTFKLRKVDLVEEGFDPTRIADPLYWLDPGTGRYEPLTSARYAEIVSGGAKL